MSSSYRKSPWENNTISGWAAAVSIPCPCHRTNSPLNLFLAYFLADEMSPFLPRSSYCFVNYWMALAINKDLYELSRKIPRSWFFLIPYCPWWLLSGNRDKPAMLWVIIVPDPWYPTCPWWLFSRICDIRGGPDDWFHTSVIFLMSWMSDKSL